MSRILLADDEPEVRRALVRVLERLGHVVEAVAGGREALRALGARPADLVITDINMPDMDGIELLLALKQAWPRTPVIAISGGGLLPSSLLLDTAATLGAVITLAKPVGVDDLAAAVARSLEARPEEEP